MTLFVTLFGMFLTWIAGIETMIVFFQINGGTTLAENFFFGAFANIFLLSIAYICFFVSNTEEVK